MSGREPTAACPEHEPDLEAYLLGTLDGSRRSRMEGHLDACPACRHALAEARVGLRGLRALAEAPAPFLDCEVKAFLDCEVEGAEEPHGAVLTGSTPPPIAPEGRRDELEDLKTRRPDDEALPPIVPAGGRDRLKDLKARRPDGEASPPIASAGGRDAGHDAKAATRWPPWSRWAAAAALLLAGIAVGRWTLPGGDDSAAPSDPPRDAWIQPAQIEALARAEVLLDLGVPWLEDLQTVLTGVIDATEAGAPEAALRELRRQARRLVLDGRKLRAALDAERDAELLATVVHAEVFLEEVAAFEPGRAPDFFTPSELSDLRVGFAAADARGAADRALLASGWIASESGL